MTSQIEITKPGKQTQSRKTTSAATMQHKAGSQAASAISPALYKNEQDSLAVDKLESMITLSTMINSTLEKSEVRARAIQAASKLINCEATSLLFVNDETGGLYFDVALGASSSLMKTIQLARGEGIAGWVAENSKPLIVKDAQNDPRRYQDADKKSGFVTRNMLCVPIVSNSSTLGVLQALNKRNGAFSKDDARLLMALANQIGVVLENIKLYDNMRGTLYSIINVLMDIIEKHDPHATGHAKRVSAFSVGLGKVMGLKKHELVNLKLAAMLHDIGMIGVPAHYTQKIGRLTEQEKFEVMKHIGFGEEILRNVKHLQSIIPAVRYHHEHWDGTGYFHRKGEAIPLFARIISVADAFDSMSSNRPYALAKGYDGAVKELKAQAGKHFDPQIVDLFIQHRNRIAPRQHSVLIRKERYVS